MISRLRHILMRPSTYAVLKTTFTEMADLNTANNPEFFMFFLTSSQIFSAKSLSECIIFFTKLARLDLKLRHHFMRKLLS